MVNSKNSSGLWQDCFENSCVDVHFQDDELPALKTVQAFMILAIIFSFISLVMFMVQLFTMEKGKRFYITGAILLICWQEDDRALGLLASCIQREDRGRCILLFIPSATIVACQT
ncbi:UNVERIFIED_CONTAM: hypothetical protein K2H54_074489 [Gekko kuhli]